MEKEVPAIVQRSSFAATTVLAGWLFSKQMTPPRPVRLNESKERDLLIKGPLRHTFTLLALYRTGVLVSSGVQAIAIVQGSPYSQLFARAASSEQQINPLFLSWNRISATVLPLVIISSAFRLRAFSELGPNFTFDLHDPNKLVTSGLYRYVQHPSYTATYVATLLGTWWFARADGVLGGILPPQLFRFFQRFQWMWHAFIAVGLLLGLRKRVSGEEKMLREKFGAEWEEWHGKTARFVPFLF